MSRRTPLTAAELEEDLRPPTEDEVARGQSAFADALQAHYGDRLKRIFLFGSRARGDHRPDSDADVAVVLEDGDWSKVKELVALGELSFDILIDYRLNIHGWPLAESEWNDPERHSNPFLVRAIRRDAQEIAS